METETKRLRNIWHCMRRRCSPNQTDKRISSYYYDKGIRVCDEWQNDFATFKEWALKNGYDDKLTIDRIDSDGNYEPSNCQWITQSENSRKASLNRGKRPIAERTPNMGKFMVIEEIEKRCLGYTFYVYKVIQTGLHKSEAISLSKELNSELPHWKRKYMARVALDCKVGEIVRWEETGQYLNKKDKITH